MRVLCVVALTTALTPPPTPRMLKPGPDARLETLSETPRIYRVANALDRATCEALMASEAASQMTTSNAPAAQLDPEKLTLLAPLILLAPLPRVISALMNGDDLFAAALPPLIGATAVAAALAYLALKLADASASGRRTSGAAQLDAKLGGDVARRIADLMETTPEHFEAPVLTRYQEGEKFALHGDASATRGAEWADEGGQRVVTCILYLNDVPEGGRTVFDQAGISVAPRQGDACVFFPSHHASKEPDPLTTHYSDVAVQEKWIVQVFERERRVPPPLGLPDEAIRSR